MGSVRYPAITPRPKDTPRPLRYAVYGSPTRERIDADREIGRRNRATKLTTLTERRCVYLHARRSAHHVRAPREPTVLFSPPPPLPRYRLGMSLVASPWRFPLELITNWFLVIQPFDRRPPSRRYSSRRRVSSGRRILPFVSQTSQKRRARSSRTGDTGDAERFDDSRRIDALRARANH